MANTLASTLKEAGTLLENRDYTNAAVSYRQAIKENPNNAAAIMGMAILHNRTGEPEEALKLCSRMWKAVTSKKIKISASSKASILVQIGIAHQQMGRLTEALQDFRQANTLFPSNELAMRIQQLENIIENPSTIEQLITLARKQKRTGDIEAAIKTYHAALQINADHPDALHGLGLALCIQKDLDGALPLIQQAIILAPERVDYYNDLGMIFQERGEFEKAISFHKRALKINADFVPAYINLGVAYKRIKKFDDAIDAYRKAIALQPDSPAAHNNLGNLLRIKGDLNGARKELKQAIKLQPSYQDAIDNLNVIKKQSVKRKPVTPKKATTTRRRKVVTQ
ncbi:MAG: tetratricopeptide repeat protein [Nitrosomonas sp.]|nr:tetratricopeptide repeat protein [Nitrosomonas sp.]